MPKFKYLYRPDDDDSDYVLGNIYRGKISRVVLTRSKHPRAIEVVFPDGKMTTVHRRSFEVSETAIDFYHIGMSILLKKVGYMADRRVTKWVIQRPLKYDLYDLKSVKDISEEKLTIGDTANKCNVPQPPKGNPIARLLKNCLNKLW